MKAAMCGVLAIGGQVGGGDFVNCEGFVGLIFFGSFFGGGDGDVAVLGEGGHLPRELQEARNPRVLVVVDYWRRGAHGGWIVFL